MKLTDYSIDQQDLLLDWKRRSPTLPDAARSQGTYNGRGRRNSPSETCLPGEYAEFNLLPDVRAGAMQLFAELGIPWHDGVDGGPSNHLRDSQVQCANALYPMVHDPRRIQAAFNDLLDVAEVLQIEPGRFLTFEYIGPTDYFNEGNGKPRTRGARCTSVDAAFRYRTSTGAVELALIEWKYTESYLTPRDPAPAHDRIRAHRYAAAVADPTGPVRSDLIAFEFMLDEPFYQLVRQQLLAHRLEQTHAEDATTVRILHVLSPDNLAYQQSLVRPQHQHHGATVTETWNKLLRAHDRFIHVDPNIFLQPTVTSADYIDRYGDRH